MEQKLNLELELTLEQQLQIRIQELELENEKLKNTISRLEDESGLDPLTGLGNRKRLNQEMDTFARGPKVAFLFLDIDRFKHFNDKFGHFCGDLILQKAAEYLKNTVIRRKTDRITRLGGDEFVISFHGTSASEAMQFLPRDSERNVNLGFQTEIQASEGVRTISITFSGGITDFDSEVDKPWQMALYRADCCLLVVKKSITSRLERGVIRKVPARPVDEIYPPKELEEIGISLMPFDITKYLDPEKGGV